MEFSTHFHNNWRVLRVLSREKRDMDLLVLALCLYLLYVCIKALLFLRKRNYPSPANLPPGPPPHPVIGNLLLLGALPHRSLTKLGATYGPIMKLKLGCTTTIVISTKSVAKEILQTHDTIFSNRMIPDSVTPFGQGEFGLPWATVSPLWRNLRRICNLHLFAAKKLDCSQGLRRKKIQEMIARVGESAKKGEPVDIGEAAFVTTLNLLSNSIFSIDMADADSGSAKEFKQIVWNIMVEAGTPNLADYFPLLKRFDPQGSRRRMTVLFGKLLDLFDEMIMKRVQVREVSGSGCSGSTSDMLDTLLDLCEDKSQNMDILQMKHLFLDLFVAGSDTTSSTAEWAMAELLRNPNKLLKAKAELEAVIGKGNTVEESDIPRLPYLQATVKETFRLHPAVPFLLPRKADSAVEVGKFTIPKGAQVLVNAWAIGRDPTAWDKPNEFIPERFLESEIDVKGFNFELIPFGGGRRICPGLPLAIRMVHLMVGSLINCFDWRLENGVTSKNMSMDDKFGITLQKAQSLKLVPL